MTFAWSRIHLHFAISNFTLTDRGDSLLAYKIAKLHIFFSLLRPAITEEERHYLDSALVECYSRFGITRHNRTLYLQNGVTFKVMELSDEEALQVIRNHTGEGLQCAGHNRISVAFHATEAEYAKVTTNRQDFEEQINQKMEVK